MRECIPYTKDIAKNITKLSSIKKMLQMPETSVKKL